MIKQKLIENPKGEGGLYCEGHFIAKVRYSLRVSQDIPNGLKSFKGSIKVLDNENVFASSYLKRLTLYLFDKDKRKLDLYCSHFDINTNTCAIDGQNDFYT